MKKGIRERWAETWGVGKELVMNLPRITLAGNREIYIENHSGIALYTAEEIIVKTPAGSVAVTGRDLRVDAVRREDIFISGQIDEIKFDFSGEIKNVK